MKAKIIHVGEVAEVLPGFSTKGAVENEPHGTHQVIMARHLTEDEAYRYQEEDRLKITPPRPVGKYLLEPGNILFMSRGSKNYAVLLESFPKPAIATSSFYILKVRSGVVPSYLAWCLNQMPVQAHLNEIRTGAGTPMIPRKEFTKITIPLPPIETQEKIARLAELLASQRALREKLLEATERLHKLIGKRILEILRNQK